MVGSQATNKPPEVPRDIIVYMCQLERKRFKNSLAFLLSTRVSCRKMMSGDESESSILKEASSRSPPHPSDVEGEQDHGFSLARAFMPLSALLSEFCGVSTGCVGGMPSLCRALRVLIAECSKPCPIDQVYSFPKEVEGVSVDLRRWSTSGLLYKIAP